MPIIKKIHIHNHPILGSKEIILSTNSDSINYKSVIIGANGTGKSHLLKVLVDIINNEIIGSQYDGSKNDLGYTYSITFATCEEEYQVNSSESAEKHHLPQHVLACAFNINDKFPVPSVSARVYNKKYFYMGVRSASNNAFIGKYKTDFIRTVVTIVQDPRKLRAFKSFLHNLNLPKRFAISFKAVRGAQKIFNAISKANSFGDLGVLLECLVAEAEIKPTSRTSKERLKKLLSADHAAQEIFSYAKNSPKNLVSLAVTVDFEDDKSLWGLLETAYILSLLLELRLLTVDEIEMQAARNYTFAESSSGEFNLLTSLFSIFSKIEDDSVIFIDEPELSLHPNWQLQYMNYLEEGLNEYRGCHCIIATHSPLLISNLDSKTSSIIRSSKTQDGAINFNILDFDTYGWSPENILYNVFGLTSTRNHYFEMDLRKAISIIADDTKDIPQLESILHKLSRFNITEDDPLSIIISRIQTYINRA